MTQILKVTSSIEYEAIRLIEEGAQDAIKVWLTPLVADMSEIDFTVFEGNDVYALKHPNGNVAFVDATQIANDFDIQSVSNIE